MHNPNFLVLDEPTNDLDIQTLQILEEYLQDFPGCVIVVSHDRYFMDKVVDHILVFKGNGIIKDFPGNYTQYRAWDNNEKDKEYENSKGRKNDSSKGQKTQNKKSPTDELQLGTVKKLTYGERLEMQRLEKDIETLEIEQKNIENQLCSGTLSVDELTEKSIQFSQIKEKIDTYSMRWLELSERADA